MSSLCGKAAGIDVHKKMLVVVVLDGANPELDVAVGRFGTTSSQLGELRVFLQEHGVANVAMESTAQYWRPVWMALEGGFALTLAQARSTRAPRGRKWDEADARRIARRLLADDLTVSYVPGPEQRDWRLLARTRIAMSGLLVQARNQIEQVLEQGQIKLTSVVSDVLGVSGRRMLRAIIAGERDAGRLAQLGHRTLRASREELADALHGAPTAAQCLVLRLYLDQIEALERDMAELERELAQAQSAHAGAIARLCAMPGFSACAAQQVIAEVGPRAEAFASAAKLASWIGVCPGQQESAGVVTSSRSPKGNCTLRRLFAQIAWAAIASKGSEAARRYRRWLPSKGAAKAAWAVAHYMVRVTWRVLHDAVDYVPRDPSALDHRAVMRRVNRVVADLRRMGFALTITPLLRGAPRSAG
jgi:transposase